MEASKVFQIMRQEIDASCDTLRSLFNKATSVKEKQVFLDQLQVVNDIRSRILQRVMNEMGTNLPDLLNCCHEKIVSNSPTGMAE